MFTRLRPLLVVVFFGLTALTLLLLANPSVYAEPLQQGAIASNTPIPTDLAGGEITTIADVLSPSIGFPQMDVDENGNPVIVYNPQPGISSAVVLVRCTDPQCNNRTTTSLTLGQIIDFAFQPTQNGSTYPIIMYKAGTLSASGPLTLDRCEDPLCNVRTNLASFSDATAVDDNITQPLVADTEGLFAAFKYVTRENPLAFADCSSVPCGADFVDSYTWTGNRTIWLDQYLGVPVVAYNTANGIFIASCLLQATCPYPILNPVVSYIPAGESGHTFMMAVNPAGQPVVIYGGPFDQSRMRIATCADLACTSVTSDQVFEEMPLTQYFFRDMAFGADSDLFAAYYRRDRISSAPGALSYGYLMLRRCNTENQCTLRNLTTFDQGMLSELVVRGNRVWVLHVVRTVSNGPTSNSIRLYMGEQPAVLEPTPGSTLTATPSAVSSPTATASSLPDARPQLNVYSELTAQLRWSMLTGAEDYQIQIARDAGFTQIVHDNVVRGTELNIVMADGLYYWRVRAVYLNDTFSAWSAVDSFVTLQSTNTPFPNSTWTPSPTSTPEPSSTPIPSPTPRDTMTATPGPSPTDGGGGNQT